MRTATDMANCRWTSRLDDPPAKGPRDRGIVGSPSNDVAAVATLLVPVPVRPAAIGALQCTVLYHWVLYVLYFTCTVLCLVHHYCCTEQYSPVLYCTLTVQYSNCTRLGTARAHAFTAFSLRVEHLFSLLGRALRNLLTPNSPHLPDTHDNISCALRPPSHDRNGKPAVPQAPPFPPVPLHLHHPPTAAPKPSPKPPTTSSPPSRGARGHPRPFWPPS